MSVTNAWFLMLQASVGFALTSDVHRQVLPTASPIITQADPWECVAADIPSYFLPPTPTGPLNTALYEYGTELLKTCTFTGMQALECPFPDHSLWCEFSDVAPATLLPEWQSYGSVANSWWAARSSDAISLAARCPHSWWQTTDKVAGGAQALNLTLAAGGCYVDANPTDTAPDTVDPTGTTLPGSQPTVTEPETTNGANGRRHANALLMVAGTSLAFAAASSAL